jgi:ech hydrogenase subunit A
MNGLVLTDNMKWLSIFWESTTLCSFFLIGHERTLEARQNARRALIINTLGGLALGLGGAFAQHQGGNGSLSGLVESPALLPLVLVLIATFTKSAQMPFQSWLLGAMVAPTPVSALLHSSTMVKAGSYLVLRLAPAFEDTPLASVIALAGAFTFAAASAIAISQSNAKKVLAYSTIANLGLIVACAGINSPLAYTAALIILIYHAISKALLFLCVGTIEQQIGSREIDDMSGIMFKMPLTTSITVIGMVSMMAPPFGMLIGKWMAIASSGHALGVLLLLVIGSALTIFFWAKWMGRIITTAYHERYVPESLPASMKGALVLLGGVVLLSSLFTSLLYSHYLRPLSLTVLARVTLPEDALILLKSVDDFMGWPLTAIITVVTVVTVIAFLGQQKTHTRLPFLCGENTPSGTRTFVFRSVMDEPVTAQVTSYYFAPWFGESGITRWANPVAFLILLTLFARIGLL